MQEYPDAFVTKLSPDGSSLTYSTFPSGSGDDEGYGIADGSGNAYVTELTTSTGVTLASLAPSGSCIGFRRSKRNWVVVPFIVFEALRSSAS